LIVADASLMIAWLLNETDVVVGEDVYNMLAENTLLVPAHWPVEISSALAVNLRKGRVAAELLDVIEERLNKFVIVVQPPVMPSEIAALVSFASAQRLTVYDACYVQLAWQNRATLATLDGAMRAAAKRLSVNVLPA
jgi:predicted nucleic acid-binding protein